MYFDNDINPIKPYKLLSNKGTLMFVKRTIVLKRDNKRYRKTFFVSTYCHVISDKDSEYES